MFYLPCDCPPTEFTVQCPQPGESWDLKNWAEERMGARLLQSPQAEGAQRVALNLCFHSSLSSSLPLFCLINPSLPTPSSFLLSVTASLWALLIFISFLGDCIWKSCKRKSIRLREAIAQTHNPSCLLGMTGGEPTQTSFQTKKGFAL